MPEFTAVTVALLALVLVLGIVLGWILRSDRCAREKIAVNAGWQQQIESQQTEHDRLAKQNKSLMEQISQYQASIKDSAMRAKELSESLKETFQRRDELQRQLKETRSNLDIAVAQRDRLQGELRSRTAKDEASELSNREKDEKIQRLSSELANWQSRVPPLVERYRIRDEEARELESELDDTRADRDQFRDDLEKVRDQLDHAMKRIAALESTVGSEHTRIEPVDSDSLPEGLDASNEPHDDTVENEITGLRDQIDDNEAEPAAWQDNGIDQIPAASAEDDAWARVPASLSDDSAIDDDAIDAMSALDSLESSADDAVPPYLTGDDELGTDGPDAAGNAHDPETADDDLRQIKGIGPSIEKILHELGFFRFRQIAEMSEIEIDRVARQLKGFRSRIYREDWIGQARMLQLQKYGESS
jgi:predicted flap endonuclease-1-like 5' DNA nuclease/chromosome segregation ATPase